MSLKHRVRDVVARTVPVSIRRAIRRRLRGNRPDIPGLPPGMQPDDLASICSGRFECSPDQTSHLQISGWRKDTTGAFRVRVATQEGENWSFFYKSAILDTEETPGLAGLPDVPRSEFAIYSTALPELARFLATVYWYREISTGVEYRLALEDLKAAGFKTTVTDEEILKGVAALPEIHPALRAWADASDHRLFRYDRRFSTELRELSHRGLEKWRSEHSSRSIDRLLAGWPVLTRVHDYEYAFAPELQTPVHGDANRANVMVGTDSRDEVKLVDWEWAGWRIPHIDLAALVKGRTDSLLDTAVESYAQSHPELSVEDHRRLLLWSLLDLRLLDASYVVAQHFGAPGASRMNLERYLHVSVEEMIKTTERLDAML